MMYRLLAVALLSLYAAFATYKWWTIAATEPLKCDNSNLVAEVERLKDELATANQQTDKGEIVRVETREVFIPIKETVYEDRVVTTCDGSFPDSVRNAVTRAVAAANRKSGLPAAEHGAGTEPADGVGEAVD